jgi:hypothetical protein
MKTMKILKTMKKTIEDHEEDHEEERRAINIRKPMALAAPHGPGPPREA